MDVTTWAKIMLVWREVISLVLKHVTLLREETASNAKWCSSVKKMPEPCVNKYNK